MASNQQRQTGKVQGKIRRLQLKIDLLGAYIANKNFTDLSGLSNYTADLKPYYPTAPKHTGTVATNVFTTTGLTASAYEGKYAIFFKQAGVTPLETTDDLPKIQNLVCDIRKITSNTITAITVTGNIATGMTDVIVMDDMWWDIAQLQDFTFDQAVSMIDVNNQMSGDYTVSVPGLKDANISANGIFFPDQHTMAQLNLADSADIAELRVIATPYKYDKVIKMTCFIGKFSPAAPVDGSDVQKWSADFANATTPSMKVIMADNTIPDFLG